MKKIFILGAGVSILLACNTNSNNSSANPDTANHVTDNLNGSQPKNQMNAVIETMNKMMHEMHNAKPTGNNDIDFAAMMIEHHKAAVEMSATEVNKGSNTELKAFAQQVIKDQNKEIDFMQA